MAVNATYISINSFSVVGDLISKFDPGRAILAYHSIYGAKLGYVNSAIYSAITNLTTVNTLQIDSENLSSDLMSIDYSSVKPDTNGLGNIPSEVLWLYRGLRKFMYTSYSTVNTITIGSGYVHIHDGIKDRILWLPSSITKTDTFGQNLWYFIYLTVPTNGLIITSGDISLSTDIPVLDYLRCGYYSNNKRAIGFFLTDINGNINWFYMNNAAYYQAYSSHHEYYVTTSWYSPYGHSLPLGDLLCLFQTGLGDTNQATVNGQLKEMEDPDETTPVYTMIGSYSRRMHGSITMFVDANKKVYAKNSANQLIKQSTNFFYLPFGLSGQC